jgi:AraC family transcriptional regulator, exoenzyme S synthesis regulatory protein ExsA
MEYSEKFIKYKGKVVFGKQSMPYFDRVPKEYFKDEACFVFVNKGEVSVRSQTAYMDLDKHNAHPLP